MGFFRKNRTAGSGKTGAVRNDPEKSIQSAIRNLESYIESAPEEIRRRMEEERTTMPPPDDLVDRRREHQFFTQLTRGEIKNEHRHQTRSALLFVLLAAAIGTLSLWIYHFLQGLQ